MWYRAASFTQFSHFLTGTMQLFLPVYVEELPSKGGNPGMTKTRLLFFPELEATDQSLQRALLKLTKAVRKALESAASVERHEKLARLCFAPHFSDQSLKFTIQISNRNFTCKYLMVTVEVAGRRVVFSPSVPEVWFDLERGEPLAERAAEVYTAHFRKIEKEDGELYETPDCFSYEGKAWCTELNLFYAPPMGLPPKPKNIFALLASTEKMNGAEELRRVGRCLDDLYPDELERTMFRERESEALMRALTSKERRPVLVVGPRLAGKTALIHEFVARMNERRRPEAGAKRNTWLVAPQRLISGMSYVGQWENRLLAILKTAKTFHHILYFDDVLGLFQAGQTSNSPLNVAQVLKPYIERKDIRILGEMTPEAFGILQEKDRGLADLFQVIRLGETSEDETLRILIHTQRNLEFQHKCRFDLEVLPTVIDLARRYRRDAVFPGKAALLLRQLANKFRHQKIVRGLVLSEFEAKTGIRLVFLDGRVQLTRTDVLTALRNEIIGQEEALETLGDIVSIAKARLNDPSRPLASLLFLGPTGVGKTQTAKALARFLFGDAEKMLRFDMNEFVSGSAVARLVGTFDQPEGLLTSAVRRQPFSIVLLDEIEKAHPDVFNLLLQVMGDGRLTDALGRTTDFTNTIIILTSNLGVRQANTKLGFRESKESEAHTYVQAAKNFFKPEFFNRLDRIVPFERLDRPQVELIAQGLIQELLNREGLVRRRCMFQIDEVAMERMVDQGFHPLLGARALKRSLERHVTAPLATQLVQLESQAPAVITLFPDGDRISAQVQPFRLVETNLPIMAAQYGFPPDQLLTKVERLLDQTEASLGRFRPQGAISTDQVEETHLRYFLGMEQLQRIRRMIGKAQEWLERSKRRTQTATKSSFSRSKRNLFAHATRPEHLLWRDRLNEHLLTDDFHRILEQFERETSPYGLKVEDYLADILRETALMQLFVEHFDQSRQRVLVLFQKKQMQHTANPLIAVVARKYQKLFQEELGLEVTTLENPAWNTNSRRIAWQFVVEGPTALALARLDEGTHLFKIALGAIQPIQMRVFPLEPTEEAQTTLLRLNDELASDYNLLPVLRHYERADRVYDIRTGMLTPGLPDVSELRTFLLSALPLPF
ncbi:MAG: AAA family ATPase [Blastocatellia bacterium]|nr:AAA family ATPase [Blastocatellia bacterium]